MKEMSTQVRASAEFVMSKMSQPRGHHLHLHSEHGAEVAYP